MDPWTAVSVAANIIQFIDFSYKLVTGASDIFQSANGCLTQHEEVDIIAQSITRLHENIVILSKTLLDVNALSKHDQELLPLREHCLIIGNELKSHLGKLRGPGSRSKWSSVRAALLSLLREKKTKELEDRLAKLQRQVDSVLIHKL